MESKIVKWFKVGKILQRKLDVSINPDSELLLWGPVQFKPFYGLDLMLTIFNRFPKTYKGYFWPKTLVLFTKDYKGLWINEISDVRKNGGKLFNDLILDDVKSYKIKEDWNESRDKVLEALKGIDKINLSELPNKELVKIWKDFLLLYLKFMEHSIVPEMANYASDHILENELKKIIPKEEIKNVMEVLTAPEEPSFYQEEEIQLSETEDIENHLKNHYWLKNGYDGVVNLDKEFFLERKKSINLNIRKTIEEYFKNTKEKKLELKNKYNIPENIMKIAFLTQDNILWQDKRKKVILMVIPYLNKFLEETIKRTKYSFEDLINLTSDHLISILEGNNLDNIINERKNGFGYYINRDNFRILNSEEMNEYWKKFTNKKIPENIHEFSGIIASKGKNPVIRGKVKIIFDPKLSNDFNENEILVTTMTSPEYVFLMKRSSAIITDYGGLTSHAAIVSRELEKPCIVGTKYATSVLKDGDLVEVDANLGMVRIIEKNKEKKDNVKWIKQLTRENTLLDRSLRTIAYAKSVEELGKAKMAKSPVVGFGKITSFYYDQIDYKEQQKIIINEFNGEGIERIGKGIVNFLEDAYKWSKNLKGKILTREEFIKYFNEFNKHHAHSRGAIVYSYWGAPVIEDKLKELLGNKNQLSNLDMTMSLLSVPKQIKNELSELHHSSDELWKKRVDLIKNLELSKEEQELIEILTWFTYLYEMGERVSSYIFDEFLNHLKQQVSHEEFELLQWYDPISLMNYFKGIKLSSEELENREKMYILEINNNELQVLSGNDADKKYNEEFKEKLTENISELKGTIASQGKVTGKVKIVITRDDQVKMNKGDILVSTMTTPRLMEAVKLAGAIVTDEGGLTAHAAIVAREFKIPCIVGTKYATQLLRDGDLVEVDANLGVVKILKRA